MKIEIKLEENIAERKIIIVTDTVDREIQDLMSRITQERPQVLAGFREDSVTLLDQSGLIRFYASAGKVFAVSDRGEYTLRLRLYELENRLDPTVFVRISNSEILNIRKVKEFDLGYTGTIRVLLNNGDTVYVSRRYMSKIKTVLGL